MSVSAPAQIRPPAWVDWLLAVTTAVCVLTLLVAADANRSAIRTLLVWDIVLYPFAVPVLIIAAWEFSLRNWWIAMVLGTAVLPFVVATWIPAALLL